MSNATRVLTGIARTAITLGVGGSILSSSLYTGEHASWLGAWFLVYLQSRTCTISQSV